MSLLFVTSSGTEVGKTFVCCRLIRELGPNRNIRVIKPIATGMDDEDTATSDTALLLEAQGIAPDEKSITRTTPWRYRAPLAPDRAAALERRDVPFDELVAFSAASANAELTVVEGIGGVMVPLDARHTVLDWIKALEPTVWLVVGSYLGALSHSLTAVEALGARGIAPSAILISESRDSVGLDETMTTLARFVGSVPLVAIPRPPPPIERQKLLSGIVSSLYR